MSRYTKSLTAEQIIAYIANDYVELSHDKVLWQRNDYIKICREWLDAQPVQTTVEQNVSDEAREHQSQQSYDF